MTARVVNFFAGPGAGKSTIACGLFYAMKLAGKRVELVTEFAKDLVYGENMVDLNNQLHVLAEQDRRMRRLIDKVDYIITDSPLVLGLVYQQPPYNTDWMQWATLGVFKTYINLNFFVNRVKPYMKYGRTQDEAGARALDLRIKGMLGENHIRYVPIVGDESAVEKVRSYLNV